MAKTSFLASGDVFITRRIPSQGYEGYADLSKLIKAHDVAFTNLEMTFHNKEGAPAAVSGGTWAMTVPECLDDVKAMGFNVFNTANNHSCDYGADGLLATAAHLKEREMLFCGTGANLGEASKPCYYEANGLRVATIGVCSSFNVSAAAGGQTADLPGRPGLNPLRFKRRYHLDPEHFAQVRELAAVTKINAAAERSIRNGYRNPPPEGTFSLGDISFVLDDHCFTESVPDERDVTRIEKEIYEASLVSDYVQVSLHAHECDGPDTTVPSQFVESFCRRCIDAGAKVVIGHGPHEIRGVELYHGGIIFYSLGNFIFETETVEFQPYDAYANKGMPLDTKVGSYMLKRTKNKTAGYMVLPEIWEALLASWTFENGEITEAKLYPIELGMGKPWSQLGMPRLSGDEDLLRRLGDVSSRYGTNFKIRDGAAHIRLGHE